MPSGPKVLIITDLEGVACVTGRVVWDRNDTSGAFQEYAALLAGEINAAAAGCYDAGAEEVLVMQGHAESLRGQLERIDPRVRIAVGQVPWKAMAEERYDALCLVGYHAMADAPMAVLSHSHSDRTYISTWLNGRVIGEIGHLAAVFGDYGTPLVFVSGDVAACNEAEELVEGVVTAPVKQAVTRFGAFSLSPEGSRRLIRERISRAVEARDEVKTYMVEPPVEFVVEFSTTDPVERSALVPGVEAAGSRRIVIRGASVTEVMDLFYLTARIV